MPNALGTLNSGGDFIPAALLYDPKRAREDRVRFRRDAVAALRRANSLYVPAGRKAACAWIVVPRDQYLTLDPYSTSLALAIQDYEGTAGGLVFKNLTVVQARCVTAGQIDDPKALYLVQLTDARGILSNEWFCQGTTSQYNAVAPAYPGLYYSASLNGGAPWTWSQMIGNLWAQMGARLGSYPGIPTAPTDPPQNWVFPGTSAWGALNDILDLINLQVAANLTLMSSYTITENGGADLAFDTLTAQYIDRLEDDLEWIDVGSGRVPASVTVYFHRRNEHYGTEETIRRDSLQWQSTPLYAVTVAAPAQFSGAAGTHAFYDDFTVRYDEDNNPLAADVASAAAIAAERVQQYYATIYRGTLGYMSRVYAGTIPFAPGGKVDGVLWKMDGSFRLGWRTEVVRGGGPDWLGGVDD